MASRDPDRPNVLFIVSDDQGPWALGAAGNAEIRTPTLDALAAGGTRLSNFFCTSPVCSPARASLFTGQIPSRHGVHDWISGRHTGTDGVDFLTGQTLVTDVAADAGYRCGLSGKWHLGANDQSRKGFAHWFAHQRGGGPYYDAPVVRDGQLSEQPGYITDAFADDASAFIDEAALGAEPFWSSLHFTAPHSPWEDNHPAAIVASYDDCEFRTCPQEPEHPWLVRAADGTPSARGTNLRAALQGYYAAITAMDSAIARVLATVERHGLTESTLVVFSSDNGFNCGQHGIWGKGNGTYPQNMYDSSVKVPAIFHQPGRIAAGPVVDELLSGYDMAPTILDWLGIPADRLRPGPGRSFAPLLRGERGGGRDRVVVFDEYGPVRMIRGHEWKYVHRYDGAGDEFYDLLHDPDERRNLIGDHSLDARIVELRSQLDEWFATFGSAENDGAQLPVTGLGQLDRRIFQPPQARN
jgi:arylsulfatase A-like enzyme